MFFKYFTIHLIGCQSKTQEWLQEVRENTDNYQQSTISQEPSITLTVGDSIYHRCCYEEMYPVDEETGHQYHIRIGENKQIVWCVMCFGREVRLQSQLEKAMCLSYGLRHELAPVLKDKYGISFANVMFVTEDSLDKESFKALSLFWSMKVVPLPDVHPDRIAGVDWHLKGDHIRPEHVFLKYYTSTMPTEIAVVSDVDVLITNRWALASALAQFITDVQLKQVQEKIGVSCMCPTMSRIGTESIWELEHIKTLGLGKEYLSYCFAILSPDEGNAYPYAASLADNSSCMGKLSDEDFFCYYDCDGYMPLPQNIMAVLSWWTNETFMEKVIATVIQMSVDHADGDNIESFWKTMEFAKYLFETFGAVHCSSAFDVAYGLGRKKKDFVKAMLARGEKQWSIKFTHPLESNKKIATMVVLLSDWAGTICWNLNFLSRQKCMTTLLDLKCRTEDYTGFKSPEEGMSKAFRTLKAAIDRKKGESWNFDASTY